MYSAELKKYMIEYENKYGPLTENSMFLNGDNWNWLSLFPKEV